MHTLKIAVHVDVPAVNNSHYGSVQKARDLVDEVISLTSLVYEKQFNVNLAIDHLQIYDPQVNPDEYGRGRERKLATTCPTFTETLNKKRVWLDPNFVPELAGHMVFTGCESGDLGLAGEGTMCVQKPTDSYPENSGVSRVDRGRGQTWRTVAHELGHILGSNHTQAGIMSSWPDP